MKFENFVDDSKVNFDESISLRNLLEKYLTHYKWFLYSIIFFLLVIVIKLRYEVPAYGVSASILIKEQNSSSSFSDLTSYEDLGLIGLGGNSLENDIQLLNSTKLMTKVVDELKLNIQYLIENSPYSLEHYPNPPIIVDVLADKESIDKISTNFEILINSKSEFEFIDFQGKSFGKKRFNEKFKIDLGNEEVSNYQDLIVSVNEVYSDQFLGETILVKISPIISVASKYLSRLKIEPVNERYSNVITLSLNETNRNKGIAIVNNLIQQYNADGINEKMQQAQSTIDFLDLRIGLISTELNAIESSAEDFKSAKGVVNVNSGADLYLESSTTNERELIQAKTESEIISYMLTALNQAQAGSLLPGNIGLPDASINRKISEYNEIVLQRNRILKSSSTLNPIIVNIDSQLSIIKTNLVGNLENLEASLDIKIQGINRQRSQISSRIASAPKNERRYKDIIRDQETKNELYLFLLQKKEEAIVSSAANVEKAKVIDEASGSKKPVSPKKILNYFGAIVLGFLVPFLTIYIKDLLDTKIHDYRDLAEIDIPFIGDIPKNLYEKNVFISDNSNSNVAEAFRFIRTNIIFLLDNLKKGKVIFITSTKASEGKTFTALNLASSFAMSGKKTLLITMDLRKPKMLQYLNMEKHIGVTNFIVNHRLSFDEVILKSKQIENLEILSSGDIPPNPVELLMSDKVSEIFDYAKEHYEYVIVDTAPVGMVTDTLQISKFADLTLYVVKANYIDKRMLHIPQKMKEEKKLLNMAFLLNATENKKESYGYQYGYGEVEKKPWYKLFKKTY